MSHTYLDETFFFKGKGLDRLRRANPSTKIAELFTVTDAGNKPWRVKTGKTRF
jgi:hypothetical protein